MSDRWSTCSPGARRRPSSGKSLDVRLGPPARAARPGLVLGVPSTPPTGAGGRTGSGLGSSVCSVFTAAVRPDPRACPRGCAKRRGFGPRRRGRRQDGRTARLRPLGRCPRRTGVPPSGPPLVVPREGSALPRRAPGAQVLEKLDGLGRGSWKRGGVREGSWRRRGAPGARGARGWAGPAPSCSRDRGGLGPGARTEPSGTGCRRSRASRGARDTAAGAPLSGEPGPGPCARGRPWRGCVPGVLAHGPAARVRSHR